jgi:hypothetical protein
MVETANELVRDRPLLFLLGMTALIIGLAMVLAHNVWSGGALPVVVSLIGWILLLRGAILLFLPPDAVVRLFEMARFEEYFYVYVAVPLVIGLYLTFAGFTSSPEPDRRARLLALIQPARRQQRPDRSSRGGVVDYLGGQCPLN